MLCHAAQKKLRPRQADFVTAYLNSKLEDKEAVYINLPEGFIERIKETKQKTYSKDIARLIIENPEGFVIKLDKTRYGLKQESWGWYTTMTHGSLTTDTELAMLILV